MERYRQDGIQDDGEEGVADVNITLYKSSNEELGTDTTDSGGKYEFCNLSSDDYYIVVDKSTLPDGYEITSQNQGDDDNNDSDINQMMGRVILLPSPMIITTPLMGDLIQASARGYDMGRFSARMVSQDGWGRGICDVIFTS